MSRPKLWSTAWSSKLYGRLMDGWVVMLLALALNRVVGCLVPCPAAAPSKGPPVPLSSRQHSRTPGIVTKKKMMLFLAFPEDYKAQRPHPWWSTSCTAEQETPPLFKSAYSSGPLPSLSPIVPIQPERVSQPTSSFLKLSPVSHLAVLPLFSSPLPAQVSLPAAAAEPGRPPPSTPLLPTSTSQVSLCRGPRGATSLPGAKEQGGVF